MDKDVPINALSVYMGSDLVGALHRTDPLSFTYSQSWLDKEDAAPLHSSLPLHAGKIDSIYVHAFFENLLPEGGQRKLISLRHHVSTVFGLLATVGGDNAGAFVLLPEGQALQQPIYQRLTWEQVHALVHANGGKLTSEREAIEAAAAGMPKPRLSISGAQFKMLLSLDENGLPLRPMGTSPSTHILKPDMIRSDINVFATAVNETIVMRAAQLCELPTAHVTYQPLIKACLVRRYDRELRDDRTLARLWQADFCQILGKPSDVKYEHDGGPSFLDCFNVVKQSSRPAVDQRNLLRWLFFNLYVGNNDSHAKNLSLLATDDGIRLAPFYDLMSTRVYSGLGPHFAFSIGGESEPGRIGVEQITSLAESISVTPKYLIGLAADVGDLVKTAIPMAAEEILPVLDPKERVLAQRLIDKINSIERKIRNRLCPQVH